MWLFTRYGFYSIACASKKDGSIDSQTMMIRARDIDHLKRLQKRFQTIGDAEIVTTPDRDYHYRLIAPKDVWTAIVAELAQEQDWANFKNEAARYQGHTGSQYVRALHRVWGIMHDLQER
jgi:hypothetical protein